MSSMASQITGNSTTCSTACSCCHYSSVLLALCVGPGDPWFLSWWRHQMETFSALLVICEGNSPVPGEFPTQRPVTRSCDIFFEMRLNKRLSKQSGGWWFETLSRPWWRHCNVAKCQKCKKCVPVMTSHVTHYSDVVMSAMKSQVTSVSIVCSTVCSCADQRKHASLAFAGGLADCHSVIHSQVLMKIKFRCINHAYCRTGKCFI